MPAPIDYSAALVDLSPRFQRTTTVAASPSGSSETVIGTLNLADFGNLVVTSGVRLHGWAAFTVGTSGVSVQLKIRQTNVSGTTVQDTGAVTAGVAATKLMALDILGFDAAPGVSTYVLTLTVGSGAAASTVSALMLAADVI